VIDKLTYAGTLSNFSRVELDNFEFIEGDICNSELVGKIANSHDAIINFAAESHVDRSISNSKDFILTNILGTQNLLNSMLGSQVNTMVQVSTDEVYGSLAKGSWDELQPLLPNSPYSASKAAADLIARSYFQTHGLDIRITRCSNNYGPNQFPEKIIPLFVTNLIEGKKVPVYGEGTNIRDWLHVSDHCQGIHRVLLNGRAGETYNIGGGCELSNMELTLRILKLMNRDETSIQYVDDRLGHDFRYSVNYMKIYDELGYRPAMEFDTGLFETIAWYIENESWWKSLKVN
jgi:dTDP-glucose 4,6-dehydratase